MEGYWHIAATSYDDSFHFLIPSGTIKSRHLQGQPRDKHKCTIQIVWQAHNTQFYSVYNVNVNFFGLGIKL